jgi:hypothetical protein
MALRQPSGSRTWGGPSTDEEEARIWTGYRQALSHLTIPQLMDRLAEINRQQQILTASLGQAQQSSPLSLSTFVEALDRPVLSSMGMASPPAPSMDRGSPPSPFPQPSPLDQLAASRRLGPRLAERLARQAARAEARRRE